MVVWEGQMCRVCGEAHIALVQGSDVVPLQTRLVEIANNDRDWQTLYRCAACGSWWMLETPQSGFQTLPDELHRIEEPPVLGHPWIKR